MKSDQDPSSPKSWRGLRRLGLALAAVALLLGVAAAGFYTWFSLAPTGYQAVERENQAALTRVKARLPLLTNDAFSTNPQVSAQFYTRRDQIRQTVQEVVPPHIVPATNNDEQTTKSIPSFFEKFLFLGVGGSQVFEDRVKADDLFSTASGEVTISPPLLARLARFVAENDSGETAGSTPAEREQMLAQARVLNQKLNGVFEELGRDLMERPQQVNMNVKIAILHEAIRGDGERARQLLNRYLELYALQRENQIFVENTAVDINHELMLTDLLLALGDEPTFPREGLAQAEVSLGRMRLDDRRRTDLHRTQAAWWARQMLPIFDELKDPKNNHQYYNENFFYFLLGRQLSRVTTPVLLPKLRYETETFLRQWSLGNDAECRLALSRIIKTEILMEIKLPISSIFMENINQNMNWSGYHMHADFELLKDPAICQLYQQELRDREREYWDRTNWNGPLDLARLAAAVALYRRDHGGRDPQSTSALVPQYLEPAFFKQSDITWVVGPVPAQSYLKFGPLPEALGYQIYRYQQIHNAPPTSLDDLRPWIKNEADFELLRQQAQTMTTPESFSIWALRHERVSLMSWKFQEKYHNGQSPELTPEERDTIRRETAAGRGVVDLVRAMAVCPPRPYLSPALRELLK